MGAGGTDSNPPKEVWDAEIQRLENQVQYDPAFTAQLGRISDLIVPTAQAIVNILFDKPKAK